MMPMRSPPVVRSSHAPMGPWAPRLASHCRGPRPSPEFRVGAVVRGGVAMATLFCCALAGAVVGGLLRLAH